MLVEEVKAKRTKLLSSFTANDLHHCSEQWQHCIQLCLHWEGDYFKGDHKRFFAFCK